MARVGVSHPMFVVLDSAGAATNNFGWLGKATTFDLSIDNADRSALYADDRLQDVSNVFGGGTLTVGLDELRGSVEYQILNLKRLYNAQTGTEYIHKCNPIPFCQVGGVIKCVQSGVQKWMGVLLWHVQFNDPGISVTTEGEDIEWQTPELTASVTREATEGKWLSTKVFSTEDAAINWLWTKVGKARPAEL